MYIEEISVKMGKGLKTYKLEDAIEASRKYFKGDELAATVWVNKYALRTLTGTFMSSLLMICIGGWPGKLPALRSVIRIR